MDTTCGRRRGGALGAALYYWYQYCDNTRKTDGIHDRQKGSYLGPRFCDDDIKAFLDKTGCIYKKIDSNEELYEKIARYISDGNVVGLMQGRMEFGPRALGNRSILGDPRSKQMQAILNLKIKYRESFRPFAPSVLLERASDYFELDCESPYMLLCADVKRDRRYKFDLDKEIKDNSENLLPVVNIERSDIPAVTHVDYSARIQTVTEETNPFYYGVIKSFEAITGCGLLINTSFNVRGEPIVCSPKDAYACFMRTEMDILVLENYILTKKDKQPWDEKDDWRDKYALD